MDEMIRVLVVAKSRLTLELSCPQIMRPPSSAAAGANFIAYRLSAQAANRWY